MTNRTFHYELSDDFDGEAKGSATLTARGKSRASALEGGLAGMRIDFSAASGNTPADLPVIEKALLSVLSDMKADAAASGLEDKVTVSVVRNLVSAAGIPIQGNFGRSVVDGAAEIQVRADAI